MQRENRVYQTPEIEVIEFSLRDLFSNSNNDIETAPWSSESNSYPSKRESRTPR